MVDQACREKTWFLLYNTNTFPSVWPTSFVYKWILQSLCSYEVQLLMLWLNSRRSKFCELLWNFSKEWKVLAVMKVDTISLTTNHAPIVIPLMIPGAIKKEKSSNNVFASSPYLFFVVLKNKTTKNATKQDTKWGKKTAHKWRTYPEICRKSFIKSVLLLSRVMLMYLSVLFLSVLS